MQCPLMPYNKRIYDKHKINVAEPRRGHVLWEEEIVEWNYGACAGASGVGVGLETGAIVDGVVRQG